MGIWLIVGSIIGIAASVLMAQGKFHIDTAKLPAPADFVVSHLSSVAAVQSLMGGILVVASIGLLRRNRYSRMVFQIIMLAYIGWFVFLSAYTIQSSVGLRQAGLETPLLFPVIVGTALFSAYCGLSIWSLNRPAIRSEFQLPSQP